MGAPGVVITKSAPPSGKGWNGKGISKTPPLAPPGLGLGTSSSSTAPASSPEASSKRLHELAEKDFQNYVCFLTTTVQAVKRTVLAKGGEGKLFSLRELPGAFERQWGTAFEKSRLGLQDLADLGALLQLFPTCFFVDMADSLGPTISVMPGGPSLRPPPEEVARMLWRRSNELQGKHVEDALAVYQESRQKSQKLVFEEASAAEQKRLEAEKAEAEAKAVKAKAKPLPPWRLASASATVAPNDAGSDGVASPRGEKRSLASSTGAQQQQQHQQQQQQQQAYSKAFLGPSDVSAPPPPPPPKSVAFGGEAVRQLSGPSGWTPPAKIAKTKPPPPPPPSAAHQGQAGTHANDAGDVDVVLRDRELETLRKEEEEVQKKQRQVQAQTQQLGYEQQQLLFQLQQLRQAQSPDHQAAQAEMQQRLNSMLATAASLQEEEHSLSAHMQQLEAKRSKLMPTARPPLPPPPVLGTINSSNNNNNNVAAAAATAAAAAGSQPSHSAAKTVSLSPEHEKLRQEKLSRQAQLQQEILQSQLQISSLQQELSQIFVLQQEVGQQLQLAVAQPGVSVYALQQQFNTIQQKSVAIQRQQGELLKKQQTCSQEAQSLMFELGLPLEEWLKRQEPSPETSTATSPVPALPGAGAAAHQVTAPTTAPTLASGPVASGAPPPLPPPQPPRAEAATAATIAAATTSGQRSAPMEQMDDLWMAKREAFKKSAAEARQRLDEQQKQQLQELEKQHQKQREQLSQPLTPTMTSPYPLQQHYLLQQQQQKKLLQLQQLERSQHQQREEFRGQLEAQRLEQERILNKQLQTIEEGAAAAAGSGFP